MYLSSIILISCTHILRTVSYTLDDLTNLTIIPTATLKSNVTISDNSTTVKLLSFDNYFYRLDNDSIIKVWDTTNPNSNLLICTISSPSVIQDFTVDIHYGHFAYIDGNKTVKIFTPTDCSQNATLSLNYTTTGAGIFISSFYVIVTFPHIAAQRGSNRGFRYYRSNLTYTKVVNYDFQKITGSSLRYSYCVKPLADWGINQLILAYNESYYVSTLQHWDNDGVLQFDQQNSPSQNNQSWSVKSVRWDYDCGFLYVVHKPPLNKISILYHDKTKFINQATYPLQIQSATPFDQKKWLLSVFLSNNSAIFYDVSATTMANSKQGQINTIKPLEYLFQKTISHSQGNQAFAKTSSKFYVGTDDFTEVYKVGCPSGITLGMGLCFDVFQQAAAQSSTSSVMELKYIYMALKMMAYLIILMQMTPFAGFFLRFINFWTICSIYSMVEIQTQQPLTSILYQIYQLINSSVFSLMGISFSVSISQQQKVTDNYSDYYGITSNFAPIIIQPVILTIIMFTFLYLFEWTKHKYFTDDNKKKFKISKTKIFFGQYISFLNVFMLPLKFVFLDLNQLSVQQKYNQIFHIIFICIGCMLPFILIFLNGTKIKKFSRTTKRLETIDYFTLKSLKTSNNCKLVKQQVSVLTFEYLQFTYISLVNILMPILGTLKNPYWFVFICGFLILAGIIVDTKRQVWKINSIVLSSELMIFHVCFCSNLIDFSASMKYTISILTMVVLMIGAAHQILTLLAKVIMDIYTFLYPKSTAKVEDDLIQKKQVSKNEVINKVIFKSSFSKSGNSPEVGNILIQNQNMDDSHNRKRTIGLKLKKSRQNTTKLNYGQKNNIKIQFLNLQQTANAQNITEMKDKILQPKFNEDDQIKFKRNTFKFLSLKKKTVLKQGIQQQNREKQVKIEQIKKQDQAKEIIKRSEYPKKSTLKSKMKLKYKNQEPINPLKLSKPT